MNNHEKDANILVAGADASCQEINALQQALVVAQQAQEITRQVEERAQLAEAQLQYAELQIKQHHSRMIALEARCSAIQQELSALLHTNHIHRQLAGARQQLIVSMENSLSWRMTAPLRWILKPLFAMGKGRQPAALPSQSVLNRCIRWAMAQPHLVAAVHWVLTATPGISAAIRNRVDIAMSPPPKVIVIAKLTTQAQRIYAGLQQGSLYPEERLNAALPIAQSSRNKALANAVSAEKRPLRIVIDMQGAQSGSRARGIGRYTLSFVQAVVRNRGEHEIILILSGLFPDTIQPIRNAFADVLPQENIRIWYAPGPVMERESGNEVRREIAELLRESFIASLKPDVVHVCSLFEGHIDDAVTSIGKFIKNTPTSVTMYDLIPLLNPEQYLFPDPAYEAYYRRKIKWLRMASRWLAISEASRQEAMEALDLPGNLVANQSSSIDAIFQPQDITKPIATALQNKFAITRPFVLYSGATDERKNLPRLIQAYAELPLLTRKKHQLVFAGKMPEEHATQLADFAQAAGLLPDELILTDYVSDKELAQLYSLCKLYVFPSWHEGFGLPALEAMACGAPVIASNTSSLPEVVGLDEALFDPYQVEEITAKITQGLEDQAFRTRLCTHGLRQAQKFSWDKTAQCAIAVWESMPMPSTASYLEDSLTEWRLAARLTTHTAGLSDDGLQALASCIALNQHSDVQRQLLVDISELCQHDAATGVQRVVRGYLQCLLEAPPPGFKVQPVYATLEHGYYYARTYTQLFLGLKHTDVHDTPMHWQRGDVFFALDLQHHVQLTHQAIYQQLRQDGVTVKFLVYDLLPIQLQNLFQHTGAKKLHERLLALVAESDGAICISKATADALSEWMDDNKITPTPNFQNTWVHIGADIKWAGLDNKHSSLAHALPATASAVLEKIRRRCSFLCVATLEPRKGQPQILAALENLWAHGIDVNLVFVGQQGWHVEKFANSIRRHPEQGQRLFWLNGISDEYLAKVYAASDCLIAASINEGFGLPLIEAAHHKLPVIARDIPVFREVAGNAAFYFKGNTPENLASALQTWLTLYAQDQHPKPDAMHWLTWQQSSEQLKVALLGQNYQYRQLLVDISELAQHDAKSGIQRVVRNILKEWMIRPPHGYRVAPIYATVADGYRYARRFISSFIGEKDESLIDDPIDYSDGDIFLGLDLAPAVVPQHQEFYSRLRDCGVSVKFVVYDLQPLIPEYFEKNHRDAFINWLRVVVDADELICISQAVIDETEQWLIENESEVCRDQCQPYLSYFHLGADITQAKPASTKSISEQGITRENRGLLEKIANKRSFLMVSTLAPHKAHGQVLDAFERLWKEKIDIDLIIVGQIGWRVDALVKRLKSHPELNKHLFWLQGISDEYLEAIYAASTCLISASYSEGFGLPLIEAAQHKIPIIVRDIPVFREVAGKYAYYFSANTGKELAQSLKDWLALYQQGKHPKSNAMPWLTWKESAKRLGELAVAKVKRIKLPDELPVA